MVFSKTETDHMRTLEMVFKKLEDAGLSISLDKCKFGKDSIEYLGYQVSGNGLLPLKKKVDAINKFPPPASQKEMLHYLGAINYFRASLGSLPPEGPGLKRR